MEGVDKKLLNYIAEQVCEYKGYAQLVQSLKEFDYEYLAYLSKCNHCELPHQKKQCISCYSSWCGRDFFCKFPENGIGVITCLDGKEDGHFCVKCISCNAKDCKGTKAGNGCVNCCENYFCDGCNLAFCPKHLILNFCSSCSTTK